MQQLSPWVTVYLPLLSTIVVAGATVVLVWLTSRYVLLTARMLEEAQRSREPAVTVDFEMPDGTLRMVLMNLGSSTARNVWVHVIKDAPWLQTGKERRGIADSAPAREGVSYLTPTRRLMYFLGFPNWGDKPDEQLEVSLRVTYENETGKAYEHIVNFDFGQMREVLFESFKDPGLAVADAIRDTERSRQSHQRGRRMFASLSASRTKQCPMCAEMIPAEARKCSRCLEMQPESGPAAPRPVPVPRAGAPSSQT